MKPGKFDVKIILKVCLTSYEGVNICQKYLYKFTWKYIIIDEAHKIKNEESNKYNTTPWNFPIFNI